MKVIKTIDVILAPDGAKKDVLRSVYTRAFREATELYLASAYLTAWDDSQKLNKQCQQAIILFGTDFGITRKDALRAVLKWAPRKGSCLVLAMPSSPPGGFHPKILAWRSLAGECFVLIGSSNMSKAAFSKNVEANILTQVAHTEFARISEWIQTIANAGIPITEDWIECHYQETRIRKPSRTGTAVSPSIKLMLPQGDSYANRILLRRAAQRSFVEIQQSLIRAARLCADGHMTNGTFWTTFWHLWADHSSRFQGSGIQFSGKSADWKGACRSLVTILDASHKSRPAFLDHIVCTEIDRLAERQNPMRGAWLSEMLCHYLPSLYPVLNSPIRKWLKANHWRGRRGASAGQQYIELARQLRYAVTTRPSGAKDLAELDLAIWQWVKNRDL